MLFFGKKEEKTEETREEPQKIVITPDVMAKLLDPQPFLEQIEAYMRGETLVREAEGYKRIKVGKPLLNNEGIQEVLKIMRMRLNEIYRMSNPDNEFIRWEAFFFNSNMAGMIAKNANKWGLNKDYYQELVDSLVCCFIAVLNMKLQRIIAGIQPAKPSFEI